MKVLKPWALAACTVASACMVAAQSPADTMVQQLRAQGYVEFEVSRTLLGRIRVVAIAPNGEQREIVFNPATGEILRDYRDVAEGDSEPRILDPSNGEDTPRAASPPSDDSGEDDAPRPNDDEDGNHGHGNDDDGSDDGNPGRGHGNDGSPGSGRGGGNNGNDNRNGGGGGNGNGNKD